MNTTTELKPIYQVRDWSSEVILTDRIPVVQEIGTWLGEGTIILRTHAGISVAKVEGKSGDGYGETNETGETGTTITWLSGADHATLSWQDHLVELRAFNEDKEWHIWQQIGVLCGRQRIDSGQATEKVSALDTQLKLRGAVANVIQEVVETDGRSLFIKTRNYLGQNGAKMTGYADMRFVKIVKKGGSK